LTRCAINGSNNLDVLQIEGKRAEILLIFDDLPDLLFFENLPNSVDPRIFFETLVNCLKNNVMAHQSDIFKIRSLKKTELIKRISSLKRNFNANSQEILLTERTLSNFEESILKDELLHYKKFENLNNEKITPYFMSLVKSKNNSDSLDNLKKGDGANFSCKNELKDHIELFYRNIYKQEDNNAKNTTYNDIVNFLGDVNGISNRFIKKFWEYFKVPLLNLCKKSFTEGELPLFLRTANIRLIPKKGDTSQIKNWRPISLLNCFYKIISRAITKRLRKYMDKLTPICQKGYSGTRYCQEVLISVIESIEKCNARKKRAGILSLDIKKAFDSLSHSFLKGVYKFFNFGPNLIKWITLMCTNRKACVMVDEMLNTNFFDLERGNAQGDTISPFLFNLGYQILLFKLELSFQIEGILSEFVERIEESERDQGQGQVQGRQGQGLRAQVNNPDPKAFALADDCSLLVELNVENLQNIVSILRSFELISGLGCNVEKTALMIVGTQLHAEPEILDIGFEVKDEIVLLGAKIKNTGKSYEGNLPMLLEKIKKQINFWKRFNLSLPGRINVAKTFLYSQINYLGCILPFTNNDTNSISKVD